MIDITANHLKNACDEKVKKLKSHAIEVLAEEVYRQDYPGETWGQHEFLMEESRAEARRLLGWE